MLYTRYRFAAPFCEGRDVLEVACGAGAGLGYLAKCARRVVGGDYTLSLLRKSRRYYGGRVPLLCIDAQALPFRASSYDVVILYEAIYYLARPERFLAECRRVLREDGAVLICTANKEWAGFNRSPFSTRYYSATELFELAAGEGFDVQVLSAFPVVMESRKDRLIALVRRLAIRLNVIPRTMKGKTVLKRLFLGRLLPAPFEVEEGLAQFCAPTSLRHAGAVPDFKTIFAVCWLRPPGHT